MAHAVSIKNVMVLCSSVVIVVDVFVPVQHHMEHGSGMELNVVTLPIAIDMLLLCAKIVIDVRSFV